jgi:bacterial/archaeal transporter family-2 protein
MVVPAPEAAEYQWCRVSVLRRHDAHRRSADRNRVPEVKFAPPAGLHLAVYLHIATFNVFFGFNAVFRQIGQLEKLTQADHLVADGDVLNARFIHTAMMPETNRANEGQAALKVRQIPAAVGICLAVLTGLLMPMQARINSALSDRTEDGILAALVSFGVGLIIMAVASAAVPAGRKGLREIGPALRSRRFPAWYTAAGVIGAFYVLTQTITVGTIGVALFTVAVVAGRTISGLLIDWKGFGPASPRPLNVQRLLGGWLAIMAVLWAISPEIEQGVHLTVLMSTIVFPLVAGFLLSFQQAMNGSAAVGYGTPLTATLVNFAAGTAVLLLAWLVKLGITGFGESLPAEPWYYVGGAMGCLFVGLAAVLVRHIGVLLVGLGLVSGQLFGSLLMDLLFPVENAHVDFASVAGAVATLAAVVIAVLPWHPRSRGKNGKRNRTSESVGDSVF